MKRTALIAAALLAVCFTSEARKPRKVYLEDMIQYVVEFQRTEDGTNDKLTLRSDVPMDYLPIPGDTLLCKITKKTPYGMCHKVTRRRKGMTFGIEPLTWQEMMQIQELRDIDVEVNLNELLDDDGRGAKVLNNWVYDPTTGMYIQKNWRYDSSSNSYKKTR